MDVVTPLKQNHFSAQYADLNSALPGAECDWLRQRRECARTSFESSGFPSPRDEEWKYTNVSAIERKRFSPSTQAGQVDKDLLARYRIDGAITLVLVDGYYSAEHSLLSGLDNGVIVGDITTAIAKHPELVRKFLGAVADDDKHGFISFNSAFFSGGTFLYFPQNTLFKQPVQVLHVCTEDRRLATTRNLIVLDEGAQATVIETYIGDANSAYLSTAVGEISLAKNAKLEHFKLQCEAEKAFHFGGIYVNQQSNSCFRQHNFAFGGLLARSEIEVDLKRAAECELNGLYLATQRQHVDNHTRLSHSEPDGVSRETYKGILDQRARGVFQGRVVVAEDAQKTDSAMNNRNLLLSADAEVDTKPQLEIYADDVKCAHGVTVGQLADESVFFLKARGIDEVSARNMLTFAFANEMAEKVADEPIKKMIQRELLKRFPQHGIRAEWL